MFKTLLFILLQIPSLISLDADFKQVKTSELLATPQVSSGHFSYRAPDYLLWEYTAPEHLLWEVNGAQTNANRNVTRMVNMILQMINGNNLQNNPQFEVENKSSNVYVMRPKQREMKRFFNSITVTLNEKTQVADKVEILEADGGTTCLQFTNVKSKY